jgi:hypothetical protein
VEFTAACPPTVGFSGQQHLSCRLPAVCGSCAATWSATRRFPPDQAAHATRLAIAEILTERLPPRRLRAFPRAVKRKMSNFKLKRPAHRSWPQPTRPDTQAIVLLPRPG